MLRTRLRVRLLIPCAAALLVVGLVPILFYLSTGMAVARKTVTSSLPPQQPVADTFVASGRPTQNWARVPALWVGYDQAGGYQIERSLLKFDLSEIPRGSAVPTARLSLFMGGTTPNGSPMTIGVYRLRDDWPENVTWAMHTALLVDPNAVATTQVSTQFGWYQWDITPLVQDWVNNPESNFGILLKGNEAVGQHERAFWSKDCSNTDCGEPPGERPRLEVEYDTPTPTPTATLTGTPTTTPTPAPRLSLLLQNDPTGAVEPGDVVTYIISYINTGGVDLTGVVITGYIPTWTNYVAGSATGGGQYDETNNQVWWSVGRLAKGQGGQVSHRVRVFTATLVARNTGTATSTWTATPTDTPTVTPAPSVTPVSSATATAIQTATPTATRRPTATVTDTPIITPSPTDTRTPTETATATDTPTATATSTVTLTATETWTPTETTTPTTTASPTPTPAQRILFDQSGNPLGPFYYGTDAQAIITVIDAGQAGHGQVSVEVTSQSDPFGIIVTLREVSPFTGVFDTLHNVDAYGQPKNLHFSKQASSLGTATIKVANGDWVRGIYRVDSVEHSATVYWFDLPTLTPTPSETITSTFTPSPTPTGYLGELGCVAGTVYNAAVGPQVPIVGASVSWIHTSTLGLGVIRGTTTTNLQGQYVVQLSRSHELDRVSVTASAAGFFPDSLTTSPWFCGSGVQYRANLGLAPLATPTPARTSTPMRTATPTWTPSPPWTNTPIATPWATNTPSGTSTVTPTAIWGTVVVTPAANNVGYFRSDGIGSGNRLGDTEIWAGYWRGTGFYRLYHGAIQFGIPMAVPSQARIKGAVVTVKGKSATYLSTDGTWQLQLLASAIDPAWGPTLTYTDVHTATGLFTVPPVLSSNQLGVDVINTFIFDDLQLSAVEDRLATTRKLSFRLDGPDSGVSPINVFRWYTGLATAGAPEPPYLILHYRIEQPGQTPTDTPTASSYDPAQAGTLIVLKTSGDATDGGWAGFISDGGKGVAALRPWMNPPLVIVNCVEGYSDQTGPVPRVCVINGGVRVYLPIVVKKSMISPPSLCDGGFEADRFEPCWRQGGELARSVVEQLNVGEPTPTIEPAYAGRYSALLGDPSLGPGLPGQPGIPVGSAWIDQAVTVPNTASPRLTFWYRIITYDVAQDALGTFWDIFAVETNGQRMFWDGNQVPGTSQRRHDLGWRRGEMDLSRWRGQTVTVRFANWNGYDRKPGAELYNTWTYLDEVQVQP